MSEVDAPRVYESRFWVKIGNDRYCAVGSPATCFRAQIEYSSDQESNVALDRLRETVDRINEILGESARNIPRDGLGMAFLVVRDSDGQDRLQLSYINMDEEVSTYFS